MFLLSNISQTTIVEFVKRSKAGGVVVDWVQSFGCCKSTVYTFNIAKLLNLLLTQDLIHMHTLTPKMVGGAGTLSPQSATINKLFVLTKCMHAQ